MEIKIYSLVDPRTNEIRYVGKTKRSLSVRLSGHMLQKPKHNTHKYNWICALKKENLKPIIIELESCDETNWVERERYWIGQYNNLTNLTAGGDGCNYYPQEILDKISNANKKAWESPEYRKNISDKRKEFWSNPENRFKLSETLKSLNWHPTSEQIKKCSDIKKEQWRDDNYRIKMGKQSAELWKDNEYKEKTLLYLRSDEHRKMVSERFKGKEKSSGTKKKISEGCNHKQQISVNGMVYDSITEASKQIPMNRGKLRTRLESKHFIEYYKIKKEG